MKICLSKCEFSLTEILRSPNISRAVVTYVCGSVEFAEAGEMLMMMHEMIVMVVVAGHEDATVEMVYLFELLNVCL